MAQGNQSNVLFHDQQIAVVSEWIRHDVGKTKFIEKYISGKTYQ